MASNAPSQLPQEEAVEHGDSEDEDDEDYEPDEDHEPDEDYEPGMEDHMPDYPDPDYLNFLAALQAARAAGSVAETVIVADSDEEMEGDGSDNEQSVGNEVVEAVVDKGRGEGGEIEVLDKVDAVELDRSSIPSCPVCFESWSSEGPHRVCCIPCGHVYGRSCLERWLNQSGKNIGKCPQCNRKFRKKEIISLYAPLIAVANDDLEKEVRCLREENKSLKLEKVGLIEEINKHKKHARDAESSLRHKMACMEHTSAGPMTRHFECSNERWISTVQSSLEKSFASQRDESFHQCRFVLQNELDLDGARVMGIDGSIVIVSGKPPGIQPEHVLTKISLLSPSGVDKIHLPPNTKAIRDLAILPGGLALLASLGKKLLFFSMMSNNLVLKYDLPAPAWSCSGDNSSPHHVYAGLQNGTLLVFDIRQTTEPMQVIEDLTRHPVHTVHSVVQNGGRRVLMASSSGPCVWEVGSSCERALLIPEMENRGVCISLACSGSLDGAVASYRPKVELPNDATPSQTPLSPSPTFPAPGKIGSHILINRANSSSSFQCHEVGKSLVSELRMSKSAVLRGEGGSSLFAYGDESSYGVHVWDLPSFNMYARLKPHQRPILDLRYNQSSSGPGFLGCISEDRLQVYSCSPC